MPASDYLGVGCDRHREALSARLDREQEPVPPAETDAHLASCADCRRWLDQAATVTRLARTGPAGPAVDVTEAALATAPGRGRGRLALTLRTALGLLGVVQLVLGMWQVTAPPVDHLLHGTGASPAHLWHETAAWNIAIGAGFVWVAARRHRPVGMLPILTVFIGALVLLSAADMLAGRVEPIRLASHGVVLLGYAIALALTRAPLDLTPPERRVAPAPPAVPEPSGAATVIPFPTAGRSRSQPAASLRRAA
jgi:predicted anti-sigma-YlaC factor YlaD